MDPTSLLQQDIVKLLLGFIVGAIIGLEREFLKIKRERGSEKQSNTEVKPGVRTFGLFSLSGTISMIIADKYTNPLFLFSMSGALAILTVWTIFRAYYFRDLGITTSVALVISFIVGVMIGIGDIVLGITLSVFVTFLLSVKEKVKDFTQALEYKEIASALQIGILFLLLFPIIPNISDPLFHVINLRSLFFFLVIILSVSFLSFITIKRLGLKQGLPTFTTLGALVNSEAVTTNLAKFSDPNMQKRNKLVANSILLANLIMIFRIIVLGIVFAWETPLFYIYLVPILGAVLSVGLILVLVRYRGKVDEQVQKIELENPLAYKTAIKFVISFAAVSFFIVTLEQMKDWGYLLAGVIGGFISNTAVLFSALSSLNSGLLSIRSSVNMVILGTASAIVNKLIYAKVGGAGKQILFRLVIDIIILTSVLLLFAFWFTGTLL